MRSRLEWGMGSRFSIVNVVGYVLKFVRPLHCFGLGGLISKSVARVLIFGLISSPLIHHIVFAILLQFLACICIVEVENEE